jgi:hypothetical protein
MKCVISESWSKAALLYQTEETFGVYWTKEMFKINSWYFSQKKKERNVYQKKRSKQTRIVYITYAEYTKQNIGSKYIDQWKENQKQSKYIFKKSNMSNERNY